MTKDLLSIMVQSSCISSNNNSSQQTHYSFDFPYAQSEIKIPAMALLGGTLNTGSPTFARSFRTSA
jgi:hypothetical protein